MSFLRPDHAPTAPMHRRLLPLLALLCLPWSSLALALDPPKAHALAQSERWLRLLHYEAGHSTVITQSYFLDPHGADDPEAELLATHAALAAPFDPEQADAHARCRFPARAQWLATALNAPELAAPLGHCPKLDAWLGPDDHYDLSLVFVSGYLENPASLFGHLLFKRNLARNSGNRGLLDTSINYGAKVPPGENGLIYVVRGLFGGYRAAYTDSRYYTLDHLYGEEELRDLWEYRLNLSAAEQSLLWLHTWELLPVTFRYYFLRDNCALYMARLLEVAIDGPRLIPEQVYWAIPVELFRALDARERDGAPLVAERRLRRSRQHRLADAYHGLPAPLRQRVAQVAQDPTQPLAPLQVGLDPEAQIALSDTLLHYYRFRLSSDTPAAELDGLRQGQHQALLARAALPPQAAWVPPSSAIAPSLGHGPASVRLGLVSREVGGNALEVGLRPALHDLLANPAGQTPGTAMQVFDLRLRSGEEGLSLERLELLRIANLNLATTDLPGDGRLSWGLGVAYQARDLACTECRLTRLTGAAGHSWRLADQGYLYLHLDGLLPLGSPLDEGLGADLAADLQLARGNTHGLGLSLRRRWEQWDEEAVAGRGQGELVYRYSPVPEWELRLEWRYARAHEGLATLSLYR